MNHRSKIIITFILTFSLLFVLGKNNYGQRWKLRRYEVGGGIGALQLFGDIGGTADAKNWMGLKDINLSETRFGGNVFMRYKIHPEYSVKFAFHYGFAKGSDVGSRNDRGRSYKATLFDLTGQFEYYLIQEERSYRSSGIYGRKGMLNNYSHFALYGFAGIGMVRSNSKVEYPLVMPTDIFKDGTNMGAIIPFGLGGKIIIDSRLSFITELGYRYSFSDYLEGYKNLNSKHNDVYYFLDFTLAYRLKTTTRNLPAFLDKRYRRYGY